MYVHHLPGDKFINGMLFGFSESASVLLWGILMSRMRDMVVFNIIFGTALISYTIYIFFNEYNMLCYFGLILLVAALGGWQNIYFLVAELRVPPSRLGSVNMIALTAGIGMGAICPYIAILPGTVPLMCSALYCISVWLSTFMLPVPGQHLPKA